MSVNKSRTDTVTTDYVGNLAMVFFSGNNRYENLNAKIQKNRVTFNYLILPI